MFHDQSGKFVKEDRDEIQPLQAFLYALDTMGNYSHNLGCELPIVCDATIPSVHEVVQDHSDESIELQIDSI
jgi:hypothetical protein